MERTQVHSPYAPGFSRTVVPDGCFSTARLAVSATPRAGLRRYGSEQTELRKRATGSDSSPGLTLYSDADSRPLAKPRRVRFRKRHRDCRRGAPKWRRPLYDFTKFGLEDRLSWRSKNESSRGTICANLLLPSHAELHCWPFLPPPRMQIRRAAEMPQSNTVPPRAT